MKTTIKLLAVFALAFTTFTQPSTAAAASVFHSQGRTAFAFFSSSDGCIRTDVFVFVTESAFQIPSGESDSGLGALVSIVQFDCTGGLPLNAFVFASLEDQDFEISNHLKSATLKTTVTLFDFVSNTSFDVSVDMTWTGVGPRTNQRAIFHSETDGCRINGWLKGASRLAEASGTVSYGATNFTPETSTQAQLTAAKDGSVFINCF